MFDRNKRLNVCSLEGQWEREIVGYVDLGRFSLSSGM